MFKTKFIFLDHASATPVDKTVLSAMMPYWSDLFYNPASLYWPAVEVRQAYQQAKQQIASFLGAKTSEIIITAGATESINLAFNGVTGKILTLAIEHPAVLRTAEQHQVQLLTVDQYGRLKFEEVKKHLTEDVELVSVALANHELGTTQPVAEVARLIETERQRRLALGIKKPLLLHCDASQAVGYLDLNLARLGVDLLTINAGKIYGPKQVGALYVKSGVKLKPLICGGGQENNLRSGTENVAGVIGLAKALEIVAKKKTANQQSKDLRNKLLVGLTTAFPQAIVSSHPKFCLPNFIYISFPKLDSERIVYLLEEQGVLVATGSACSSQKLVGPSIAEILKLPPDYQHGSLRLTLGRSNNQTEINQALKIIVETIQQEYKRLES